MGNIRDCFVLADTQRKNESLKEKPGAIVLNQNLNNGIKKPGSLNRALGVLDPSALFSLDLLSSVLSFSF